MQVLDLAILDGAVVLDIPGFDMSLDDKVLLDVLRDLGCITGCCKRNGLQCLKSSEYAASSGQVLMNPGTAMLIL